jgi:16S rRNA (cytidine1402-2'-O)-methyltransferase
VTADGGRLVLVGTPIGNLGDLSPRAVEVLSTADVIVCEDTRVTRKLLSHAGIRGKRLVAMHEHNEASVAAEVVALVVDGATVAVVTDAGMPGISDPGSRLVKAAASAAVSVEVVPGPSAALAALVVSGLPTDRFCFEGFLPRKGGEKAARLAAIAAEPRTVVLFESPRRVRATVDMLASVCGGSRSVAVAREMTKVHEEVWRGTLEGATAWLSSVEPRGEYVLVIGGAAAPVADDGAISAALADRLAAGEDRKTAVGLVAAALGVPKRRVYEIGLRLRNSDGMREGSR